MTQKKLAHGSVSQKVIECLEPRRIALTG